MKRWQLGILTAVLALAFSMEQADVGVLQSMYGPIAQSLGCSAVAVGTLTTWRGVVQVSVLPLQIRGHSPCSGTVPLHRSSCCPHMPCEWLKCAGLHGL